METCWSWVVLTTAFIDKLLVSSLFFSFSVVLVEAMRLFDEPTHIVAIAGSIHLAFLFMLCFLSGALVNYFGHRKVTIAGGLIACVGVAATAFSPNVYFMYVTYGAVTGTGMSMIILGSTSIVPCYFDKRKALAMGFNSIGVAVSALAAAPIVQLSMDNLGWKWTFLVHAGLVFISVPTAATFRPVPTNNDAKNDTVDPTEAERLNEFPTNEIPVNERSESAENRERFIEPQTSEGPVNKRFRIFDCSVIKERRFMVYCVAIFLVKYGTHTFVQHIIKCAINRGIVQQKAALLPAIMGTGALCSLIVSSFVALKANHLLMFFVCNFVTGCITILMFIPDNFLTIAVFAAIFGVCKGTSWSCENVNVKDMFDDKRFPYALAITYIFEGACNMIASPVTAKLLDTSGRYDIPFAINGSFVCIGSSLALGIYVYNCVRDRRNEPDPNGTNLQGLNRNKAIQS